MSFKYEFPVHLGQTLWVLNYPRHCIDKVVVAHLWISEDGHVRIGIRNDYGERYLSKSSEDIGVTVFTREDIATAAFLSDCPKEGSATDEC